MSCVKVVFGIQYKGYAGITVTATSTDFLIIPVYALWYTRVYDTTDVGLVYP